MCSSIDINGRANQMGGVYPLSLHGAIALALLLPFDIGTAVAGEPEQISIISEPTKCYQVVWGSKEGPGLGLTAGQAVMLCSGATSAATVVRCFLEAWGPPDSGGLGLTAGQAITLCKANSLEPN